MSPSARSKAGAEVGVDAGHDESTEFLLRSLRDLEAERAAGDIDDDDYAALRDEYTARAAAALRAEERGRPAPVAPAAERPRAQRLLVVAGVVAFALLTGVLVAQAVGRRDDGEGITGEITQTPTQQASECIDLTVSGELVDAVPCYEEVLATDPDNAVAHTYLGWTLYLTAGRAGARLPQDVLAGLYGEARSRLDQAVESDPGYADARAFQVVVAVREERFEDAAAQLEAFDGLDAPADVRQLVDGIRPDVTAGLAGEGAPGDESGGGTPGGDGGTPETSAPATTAPS